MFNGSFFVEQGPKEDEKNETRTDDEEIVDPVVYNPEKNCYHPLKHACWKHKERLATQIDFQQNTIITPQVI